MMKVTVTMSKEELDMMKKIFSKVLETEDEDWWNAIDNRVFLGLGLKFNVPEVLEQLGKER